MTSPTSLPGASDTPSSTPTSRARLASHELDGLDATAMAELVSSGQIHPTELVEHAIDRIESLDSFLDAVVHRQFERALAEAAGDLLDGPFRGVPFLLKDYSAFDGGEPYGAGMRAVRAAGWRAPADDGHTRRFRAAGLVVVGRTNTPELASVGTTEPAATGPTHNPWDLRRSPGGSSGGAGAAVAVSMVPAAHANDISGSIRIPAAHCGLVGLKASRGRLVGEHGPPLGWYSEGVLTRTVRDAAGLSDVLANDRPLLVSEVGREPGRLRIGVTTRAFSGAEVDVHSGAAATEAASLLESLGHDVTLDAPEALYASELYPLAKLVLAAITTAELDSWSVRLGRELTESDLEPTTWGIVQTGRSLSASALLDALTRLAALSRRALSWWTQDGYDLLVTPTCAGPPTVLGEYLKGYESGRGSAFTRPFNVTGQPAISLPLGWPADGLPRGVQLVAAPDRDDILIRVAAQLETAAPWIHRRPHLPS